MIHLHDFAIASLMAWGLVITGIMLLAVTFVAVYWMRECKQQEDYINELLQRLRPYEQPGGGTIIIPDVEVWDDRTQRYEPVRVAALQD